MAMQLSQFEVFVLFRKDRQLFSLEGLFVGLRQTVLNIYSVSRCLLYTAVPMNRWCSKMTHSSLGGQSSSDVNELINTLTRLISDTNRFRFHSGDELWSTWR